VDIIPIELHIEHVFGQLIQPPVERIITAVWFWN